MTQGLTIQEFRDLASNCRGLIEKYAKAVDYTDARHLYRIGGLVVPGVSSILRPISDVEMEGIPADILEVARKRGSAVHAAIAEYFDTGFDLADDDIEGYMAGAMAFLSEHKVVRVAHEIILQHLKYMYAGRSDLVCFMDDMPDLTVIDFKCTDTISITVPLQLHLYTECLNSYGLLTREGHVVHLFPNGTYECLPASKIVPDTRRTAATAMGLLSMRSYVTRYSKDVKKYAV